MSSYNLKLFSSLIIIIIAFGFNVAAESSNSTSTNPCAKLSASEAAQTKSNKTGVYWRGWNQDAENESTKK
jgi:hypothetical protein